MLTKTRTFLRRRSFLRPALTRARHLLLARRLSPVLVRCSRAMSRARGINTNDSSHVEPFPVDDVVASLRRDGVATGLRLSPSTVAQLLNGDSTERLIRDIAHSQRLVAVAQAYLG